MSPARPGQKPAIPTRDILEAVEMRGRYWPAAFADWEITAVNEAVDREQLRGHLDGITLTASGRDELNRLRALDTFPTKTHNDLVPD